jgi:uncharacterized membrane protein
MRRKTQANTIAERNIQTIAEMERAFELHRTVGERVADRFAAIVGSWAFIISNRSCSPCGWSSM